jgi:hypothetical protein
MPNHTVIINYEWALARPPGAEASERALFLVFHAEDAEAAMGITPCEGEAAMGSWQADGHSFTEGRAIHGEPGLLAAREKIKKRRLETGVSKLNDVTSSPFKSVEWHPHMLLVGLNNGSFLAFARPEGELALALDDSMSDMDSIWICALGEREVVAHACFDINSSIMAELC